MEVKKARPLVYQVYDYLCKNCMGKENKIGRRELAQKFGVSDVTMRGVCHEINMREEFDKVVCRMNGIHIAQNQDELNAYVKYQRHKGLEAVYEAWMGSNKGARNGQEKIAFGDYYKEFCDTFGVLK